MGKTINPYGNKIIKLETEFCSRKLTIETGRLAFQAGAAVTVTYGDNVVTGIATAADKPNERFDYFPLSIDYEEKMYAAGKISGSRFIKREGRPSEDAILTARLIDRPIRPLFPKGYKNEVQGIATVMSYDPDLKPDSIAMIAVSCALMLSGAPFDGPIGGVRIGLVDDELVAYPSTTQLKESKLDLTVAGTKEAIMMVEAGAKEVSEETIVEALNLAHEVIQPVIALQEELAKKVGVVAQEYEEVNPDEKVVKTVDSYLDGKLGKSVRGSNKEERSARLTELKEGLIGHVEEKYGEEEDFSLQRYKDAFENAIKQELRRAIVEEGVRPDGRGPEDIRPLSSEVGMLPRAHGSSIFTRGSTQAVNVTTLAPLSYAQVIDTMESDREAYFIHHYNMPGYTVGEIRRLMGPGRREIGHGHLAQRALEPVIPSIEEFPYTIRTVSEMMSSNGSTSMASVCSGCLSLMDAGVPISKPVSGIAMGLITGGDEPVILSDIQGAEDFAGDMDFKVAGTKDGVTALQMDIKVHGITPEIMSKALARAKVGRDHILDSMLETLAEPRTKLSKYAPQVKAITINPDKTREVIGKGGETINRIIDETGAEIDIRDGGQVMVSAPNEESIAKAIKMIEDIVEDPEIGTIYEGEVVKMMDFGVFVNIMPGQDGLVHVSEMAEGRVNHPSDVVSEGDTVKVKLVAIDDRGRLNLSMVKAL